MTHVSRQARESSTTTHITKGTDKEKSTAAIRKTQRASQKTAKKATNKSTAESKATSSVKKSPITAPKSAGTRSEYAINKTASANFTEKRAKYKGYKSHCVKVRNAASGTLADAYRTEVQRATRAAVNKLMQQIGKSYYWGGSSPRTGFDCSGLVYCVCKDLVKIRVPRTANEMYHLRGAAPIEHSELRSGSLVFFRTQRRDAADHVGVYVGNGRFIQSPYTGQEIQITSLSEDYWQRHYADAHRAVTPETLR